MEFCYERVSRNRDENEFRYFAKLSGHSAEWSISCYKTEDNEPKLREKDKITQKSISLQNKRTLLTHFSQVLKFETEQILQIW